MYNIISAGEYKLGIICVLILFFIIIICKNINDTSIEGFGIDDIGKITSTVTNIAKDAGSIPGKITDLGSKIGSIEAKIEEKITKKIDMVKNTIKKELFDPITEEIKNAKNQIKDIFSKLAGIPQLIIDKIEQKVEWLLTKIKRFGQNIGDLVKGGIIQPFMTLFQAMGHMFVMTGKIAMKVIDKIKSLPNCSIIYMFKSVYGIFHAIYKDYIPGFIRDIISTIYTYTLKVPLEYLSCLIGLTAWWDKCLSFNVDDEVNSIKKKFNQVGPAFKKTFGKMDFKDLFDLSKDKQKEKEVAAKAADEEAAADEKADVVEQARLYAQQMLEDALLANSCNKIVTSEFANIKT